MQSREQEGEDALLKELKAVKKTVRRNFQDMVHLLTSAISLSSSFLGGHLQRVAETSRVLADALGLSKEESYIIYYAGLLHDIGLIGFSHDTLTNPEGPQTEQEKETYFRHPKTGEEILNTVYDLRRTAKIIRSHHENYNGEGFPDQRKGEDIPLGARILRIATDYDEFLYLQGYSSSQALDNIFVRGGQLYDPDLVEQFANLIRSQRSLTEEIKEVSVEDLKEGQFLQDDIFLANSMLLIPRGMILNNIRLDKIHAFSELLPKRLKVRIRE